VRRMPLLYPAAVEQDVNSVSVIEDLGHERGDGGVGGEVGGVDCGFAAEGFDGGFGGLVGGVALGTMLESVRVGGEGEGYLDEEDVCAGFCEGDGH